MTSKLDSRITNYLRRTFDTKNSQTALNRARDALGTRSASAIRAWAAQQLVNEGDSYVTQKMVDRKFKQAERIQRESNEKLIESITGKDVAIGSKSFVVIDKGDNIAQPKIPSVEETVSKSIQKDTGDEGLTRTTIKVAGPQLGAVGREETILTAQATKVKIEDAQPTTVGKPTALSKITGVLKDAVSPAVEKIVAKAEPVIEKVQEKVAPVIQKVEDKAEPIISKVQTVTEPIKSKVTESVSSIIQKSEPVTQKITSAVVTPVEKVVEKTVDLSQKIIGTKKDADAEKKLNQITGMTAADITTKRKQDLLDAQINALDSSIVGRDFEKEKALAQEKEKLSSTIAAKYPSVAGTTTPGLELTSSALMLEGTKERAIDAYNKAIQEEQQKQQLQSKISGDTGTQSRQLSPFELAGAQYQLEQMNKSDVDVYKDLLVEAEQKSGWFRDPVKLARDKADLKAKYNEAIKAKQDENSTIALGAKFVAQELDKDISEYQQKVNTVNQQVNLYTKKENEFKQLESKFENAKSAYQSANAKYERLLSEYQRNPNANTESAAKAAYEESVSKYQTADEIYSDYKQYGESLQDEANALQQKISALESTKQTIESEQKKAQLAQKAYQDNIDMMSKYSSAYESSVGNIESQDIFKKKKAEYQESLDYFKDAPVTGFLSAGQKKKAAETGYYTSDVSWLGKQAGIASAALGKFGTTVASSAEKIPEFLVVSPGREIKEDIQQGDFGKIAGVTAVAPGLAVTQYWAKGIYDWDDPRNKDYNWKVNTNWKAVEGAIDTALIAASAAKPIAAGGKATVQSLAPSAFKQSFKAATATGVGKFAKRLGVSVVGSAVGTGAAKTIGYGTASKAEQDFIERGTEFKGAMQAGIAAERQASSLQLIPGGVVGGKGKGDVGTLLYDIPGGPLVRTGIQKIGGDESRTLGEFEQAVRDYYTNKGYSPSQVETAVSAALRQRKSGMYGEVVGTLGANVASEVWGQKMLKEAGVSVIKGQGTFWKPAIQIGKAGFIEGVAGELSTQIGRYEDINVKDLAKTGAIGAVTAGLIGGGIAKLSGKPGGKALQTAAYLGDPYEKPGDIIAGVFEKASEKAAKKAAKKTASEATESLARRAASAPVITVVPSTTMTPTTTQTPTLTTTPTQTILSTPTQIQEVALTPSQKMGLMTFDFTTNIPTTIKVPTQIESIVKTKTPTTVKKTSFTGINVPTITEVFSAIKKPSAITETPIKKTLPEMSFASTPTEVLIGVKSPTEFTAPVFTSTSSSSSSTSSSSNVPVPVPTPVFTDTFATVPVKTSSKAGAFGAGLGDAYWLAQQGKGSFGWNIENKIQDFAGEFLSRNKPSVMRTPKKSPISKSMNDFSKKLKSLI